MKPAAKTFSMLFVIGGLVLSCQKEPATEMTLSTEEIILDSDATEGSFFITPGTVSDSWSISVGADWLQVEPASGTGTASITVRALSANNTARSTNIIIRPGAGGEKYLVVRQSEADFWLSTDEVAMNKAGNPVSVKVNARPSVAWEITNLSSFPWLHVDKTDGAGKSTITLSADRIGADESGLERNAGLIFRYGVKNRNATLSVSQITGNAPPAAPGLQSPANNALLSSRNLELSWSAAADPDGDEVAYDVFVSKDNRADWQTVAAALATTGCSVPEVLDTETVYYWKVAADDGFGGRTESEVRSFTLKLPAFYPDGEAIILQHESAGAPNYVPMYFTGEGYVEEDHAPGGVFETAMKRAMESFFDVEPYRTYRNYFRIYAIAAHSEEPGATILESVWAETESGYMGPFTRNTAYGVVISGGGTTRISVSDEGRSKIIEYATRATGREQDIYNSAINVIINLPVYAGTCHFLGWYGGAIAFSPLGLNRVGADGKALINHEGGGHGFSLLADEYVNYPNAHIESDGSRLAQLQYAQSLGTGMYENVSLTDNRSLVRWRDYFTIPGYERVSLYEGAYYYGHGVWRSEATSCMINNIPYYNAISRELIVRRTLGVAGVSFNFNEFLSKDLERSPASAPAGAPSNHVEAALPPLHPPQFMN